MIILLYLGIFIFSQIFSMKNVTLQPLTVIAFLAICEKHKTVLVLPPEPGFRSAPLQALDSSSQNCASTPLAIHTCVHVYVPSIVITKTNKSQYRDNF